MRRGELGKSGAPSYMQGMLKVVIVSGTNRRGSQTLRVSRFLERKYREAGAQVTLLDLTQLPSELFTPDSYAEKPKEFDVFSKAVLESDGLVIVTPEYNGSFPGVLKYFIDHLKFPESFEKRPVAFVGLAAGMWGALRSVEQLQAIFAYRNAYSFNERVFLPRVESQLDPQGEPKDPLVRSLFDSQVKNFLSFVGKLSASSNHS
jgi:chromate reductase